MIVPENIFDIAPPIKNMANFKGLGAKFKSFQNKEKFSISITFEVFSNAYYNDEILIINNKKMDIGDLDLSQYSLLDVGKLSDLVHLDGISQIISKDNIKKINDDIVEKLGSVKDLNSTDTLPDCPPKTDKEIAEKTAENTMVVEIKNKDNEVIKTVTKDLTDDSKICKTDAGIEEKIKNNFLSALPKINPGNNIKPSIEETLCKFEDNSELKTMVQKAKARGNISQDSIKDYNSNLIDNLTPELEDQLNIMKGDSDKLPTSEDKKQVVNDLTKEELPQYGMPLLQINLEHNIIIQIVDGKLSVLNFEKYISGQSTTQEQKILGNPNIAQKKLEIEIVNDNAKIIPGVIYTMVYTRKYNYHTLELKRYYHDEVFEDKETSSIDTGLYYLGVDKSGLKQFCGKFYDVHLQEDKIDINDVGFDQSLFPTLYGALAYYDFYNKNENDTRVVYNKVFPYKSYGKPLSLRGKYWYLETRKQGNYTFPNHAIIDDMFCKNKFTNKSFTISFFIKRNSFVDTTKKSAYVSSIKQVIISDPINNNSINYNEEEMLLTANFHGKTIEQYVNFVPGKWYQITFRYRFETQEMFLDTFYKDLSDSYLTSQSTRRLSDTSQINDTQDEAAKKHFMLNSFFAEYSYRSKGYQYPFDTLCGPIILFDSFISDERITGIFEAFYPVLYYYKNVGGEYTPNGILLDY